jgi:predicted TIM-barrel fold metal-dependent hydrolase
VPLSGYDNQYWLVDGKLCSREAGNLSISVDIRQMRDLPGRLAMMDETGVDVQVLYPTLFLNVWTSNRPEINVALARSYNRWLAEVWKEGKGRFRWAIVPPVADMPSALNELEFGKANGACGVFLRGIEGEWLLDDPYLAPLYNKAIELDLPICIHAGNGNNTMRDILFRKDLYYFGITPILASFNRVVTSAIPEQFPGLRFGFIEAGSQWVPYLVREAARRHEVIHTRGEVANEYTMLRDKRIWVTLRTDDDLPYVMQYAGHGNLLIGTDFGHDDPAAELDALGNLRETAGVDPKLIDDIMDANARAFYAI